MSREVRALFIGGPAAGDVVTTRTDAISWFHSEPTQGDLLTAGIRENVTEYTLCVMGLEGDGLYYYRPAKWTGEELVMHLVNTYREKYRYDSLNQIVRIPDEAEAATG